MPLQTQVNDVVVELMRNGVEWGSELALLRLDEANVRTNFESTKDWSLATDILGTQTRIREVENIAATAIAEVLESYEGVAMQVSLTELGKSQTQSPIHDTFRSSSAFLNPDYGKQKRADHFISRAPKMGRGTIHRLDIFNGLLTLDPLKGHYTRANSGFYIAKLLDENGEALVKIELCDPKISERVWPLTLISSFVRP